MKNEGEVTLILIPERLTEVFSRHVHLLAKSG
jgi:hypothetical protein